MNKMVDQRFLNFATYEDYLDSFVTKHDVKYLRSTTFTRKLAELGCRSLSETVTKEQFQRNKDATREALFAAKKSYPTVSDGKAFTDTFLRELAFREKMNRSKTLSTIIFVRVNTKSGFEVSGYIDYEQNLRRFSNGVKGAAGWNAIFAGTQRLKPKPSDLSYYNWRTGNASYNDSDNYEVIPDPQRGLCFTHKSDRTIICVDPLLKTPGTFTTKTAILSDNYNQIVLYDHVVRSRI